jgi:hypothetical protein
MSLLTFHGKVTFVREGISFSPLVDIVPEHSEW